nr:2Fe-2S iron-sulfur cluster-binding protein [Roseibium aestuarii]
MARPFRAQGRPMTPLTLTVNGIRHELRVDPRRSLLDLVRDTLDLTGAKKGCDHGQCGACTMIVNGRRINSCLSLAVSHDGDEVTTIEGVAARSAGEETSTADAPALHPLQQAFIEHDAFQCGFCTSGQICSGIAALEELAQDLPSLVTVSGEGFRNVEDADALLEEELRERMSGNLCRCGAYPNILAALRQVMEAQR